MVNLTSRLSNHHHYQFYSWRHRAVDSSDITLRQNNLRFGLASAGLLGWTSLQLLATVQPAIAQTAAKPHANSPSTKLDVRQTAQAAPKSETAGVGPLEYKFKAG